MPLCTLAIQNAIDMRQIGWATSASQFFRQISSAIAASLLGAVLTLSLGRALPAAGHSLPPAAMATAEGSAPIRPAATPKTREAFAGSIRHVYGWTMVLVAAGWLVTLLIPELPLRKTNAVPPAVAAD